MENFPRREESKTSQLRLQEMADWRKITVGATGHRPDKMGGYSNALGGYKRNHPIVTTLRGITLEVMEDLIKNHGMTRFVSGEL
ncbi:hypothetical protein [Paenibacillus polymyxa]|uniref:hypothetical protein n=1 Tax=Paenibacillus polymyxa TaxID=1406 RepID=UPI0001E6D200|nr:hypothetical protein [Paenibacillus polymyxa]WPQ59462.1 hypothetical protein SKN87_27760 [Paenibacillus polymyxa]